MSAFDGLGVVHRASKILFWPKWPPLPINVCVLWKQSQTVGAWGIDVAPSETDPITQSPSQIMTSSYMTFVMCSLRLYRRKAVPSKQYCTAFYIPHPSTTRPPLRIVRSLSGNNDHAPRRNLLAGGWKRQHGTLFEETGDPKMVKIIRRITPCFTSTIYLLEASWSRNAAPSMSAVTRCLCKLLDCYERMAISLVPWCI